MEGSAKSRLRRSINNTELLIAVGEVNGDPKEVEELITDKESELDIEFADENGDTALHAAVRSNRLAVVQMLLDKGWDVSVENKDNKIPLDLVDETSNPDISEALVQKEVDDSFEILEDILNSRPEKTNSLSQDDTNDTEYEIARTGEKIRCCLELLETLDKPEIHNAMQFSGTHALLFINFLETFALDSFDAEINGEMKNYFSPCYTEEDRTIISNARTLLLEEPDRELKQHKRILEPADVGELIIDGLNISSFFDRLQKYVQQVLTRIEMAGIARSMLELDPMTPNNVTAVPGTSDVKESVKTFKNLNTGTTRLSYDQVSVLIHLREQYITSNTYGEKEVHSKFKDNVENARLLFQSRSKISAAEFEDTHNFFIKLGNISGATIPPTESIKLNTFLKESNSDINYFQEDTVDDKSFIEEFKKLIEKAFGKDELTPDDLFNFLVNFYPRFLGNTEWNFMELSDLRNRLMHNFYKYGCIEFRDVLARIRHELFKYGFALKLREIIGDVKEGDDPGEVRHLFEQRLRDFKTVFETEIPYPLAPPDEGGSFYGYKFSESIFPKEITNFSVLANQYVKFKYLTHISIEREEEEHSVPDNYVPTSKRMRKLVDSDRRKMFEEFDRLERIKTDRAEEYYKRKEEFKRILVTRYGVNGSHFDEMYKLFDENNGEFLGRDDKQAIAEILNNLKRLSKAYLELCNQDIISLYDRFVTRKPMSTSRLNQFSLTEIKADYRGENIRNELDQLPKDAIIKLPYGDKTYSVRFGEVINDMLGLFCNAHNTYRVDFEIKDVFNDDTFLDYMVRDVTDSVDVEKLVDQYYKFMVEGTSSSNTILGREVFEHFLYLSEIDKTRHNDFYQRQKIRIKSELSTEYGVEEDDFNRVCESYIEKDNALTDSADEVELVESIIRDRQKRWKSDPFEKIPFGYFALMGGKSWTDFEADQTLFENEPKTDKTPAQKISSKHVECKVNGDKELEYNLTENFSDLIDEERNVSYHAVRNGDGNFEKNQQVQRCETESDKREFVNTPEVPYKSLHSGDVSLRAKQLKNISIIIETYREKRELQSHNSTRMKTLLNVDHVAPYITRLLKEAKSDKIMDKADIQKLIGTLLTDEDSLYIKHLNDLLSIKSCKLDLYEEVCDQILTEKSFRIDSLLPLFDKPEHVEGILAVLGEKIDSQTESRVKTVLLTKEILRLLNSVVLELISSNDIDKAKLLCDKLKATYARLDNGEIRHFDSIILEYKLNTVEVKNAQGKGENRTRIYEEVVKDLEEILDGYEDTNYPKYLSVLCRKAYILKMLKRYHESHGVYENLYNRIVEYVLKSDLTDSRYTVEVFGDIENSRKYRDLLASSEESERYLDIVDILCNIAYNLREQEGEQARPKKRRGNVKNCEKALEIYEKLYSYRKGKLGQRDDRKDKDKQTVRIERQIAYTYTFIGRVLLNRCEYSTDKSRDMKNALRHFQQAQGKHNRVLRILRKIYGSCHKLIDISMNSVIKNLCFIACAHNTSDFFNQSDNQKEVERHRDNALKMFEKVTEFQNTHQSRRDSFFWATQRNIASTHNVLGSSSRNRNKAKEHFENALTKYEEVLAFQESYLSPKVESIWNTHRQIAFTLNKLGSSIHSSFPRKAEEHYKNALAKYQEILHIQEYLLRSEDECIWDTQCQIAFTLNKLGSLVQSSFPKEAEKYYKNALAKYRKVLHIQKSYLSPYNGFIQDTQYQIAFTLNKLGSLIESSFRKRAEEHYKNALAKYEEVLKFRESYCSPEDGAIWNTQYQIALTLDNLGSVTQSSYPKEAEKYYEIAIVKYREVLHFQRFHLCPNAESIRDTQCQIAFTLNKLGSLIQPSSPEEAEELHENALAEYQEVLKFQESNRSPEDEFIGNTQCQIAIIHNHLGSIMKSNNQQQASNHHNEALQKYREALHIQESHLSPDDQLICDTKRQIAFTLNKLGCANASSSPNEAAKYFKDALAKYQEVLKFQESNHSSGNASIWNTQCQIGFTLDKLGSLIQLSVPKRAENHFKKALAKYHEVLHIQKINLRPDDESIQDTQCQIASTLNKLGSLIRSRRPKTAEKHYKNALGMYREVLEFKKSHCSPEDESIRVIHDNIAFTYDKLSTLLRSQYIRYHAIAKNLRN